MGPCHLHCALSSQIFILPSITANICLDCQDLKTHTERKQSGSLPHPGNNNDWVPHKAEADRITTCFVASVPLRWFPEDDPGLVTLQHCHQDSRHVPCSPRHRERHCVIDELLSLISNTRYLSLSDISLSSSERSCMVQCVLIPLLFSCKLVSLPA